MHLTSLISNKSDWTTFNKPRETVDKAQGGRRQTSVLERRKWWPKTLNGLGEHLLSHLTRFLRRNETRYQRVGSMGNSSAKRRMSVLRRNTQDTVRTDTEGYDREGPVWSNSAAEVIDVAGRGWELLEWNSPHLCIGQRLLCVVSKKTVSESLRRGSNIVSSKFFGVGWISRTCMITKR